MKNLIITSSDSKYGNFLIKHWLKSLQENVNLNNIDILVLDYGLTPQQISLLKEKNVLVKSCKRDAHVTAIRHRDTADFLKKNLYSQILFMDSGDIIFQSDISKLFDENKESFREVFENYNLFSTTSPLLKSFFRKEDNENIEKSLKNRKLINAGVIFGPAEKFIDLCESAYNLIENKDVFGPDQMAINYILSQKNFVPLSEIYNFVITTAKEETILEDDIFYLKNRQKIPIVHNAGGVEVFRPVENFGYGKNCNNLKTIQFKAIRAAGKIKHKVKSNSFLNKAIINVKHF